MRLRVLSALTTVGLAGCGGGEPLTREGYAARGNAICAKTQRELDALDERDLPREEIARRAAPIAERQTDELLELEPPESLAPQTARLEEIVDEVRELNRKIARGEITDPIDVVRAKGKEADRTLDALGLDRCRGDA